jgi:phospholipase/carboxylesterase
MAPGETSGPFVATIGQLLTPLLGTLDRVGWVQRHLHPAMAERLAAALTPETEALGASIDVLGSVACPDDLCIVRDRLIEASRETIELVHAFVDASREPGDIIGLYRPLRRFAHVQETLYPLAPALDPVSRWFLEPARRDDDALIARLRGAALGNDEARVGVFHVHNERSERGGFSVYVPEAWDGRASMPLAVALHGGSGHGRDFLWTWVRDARSRGALLISPTARDRTWSIMGGEDVDAAGLCQAVEAVAASYPVDRTRILLTGMSDGATYTLLGGLAENVPFTHLAPVSGVLHPFLFANGGLARARGRPIYLVHGALDWMFPVAVAQQTREVLAAAGAHVVYRELEDLSHTYPRDENPHILDWLAR